eukprot:scaffold311449_cov21-Tisochrysis_lutea.AAC.1
MQDDTSGSLKKFFVGLINLASSAWVPGWRPPFIAISHCCPMFLSCMPHDQVTNSFDDIDPAFCTCLHHDGVNLSPRDRVPHPEAEIERDIVELYNAGERMQWQAPCDASKRCCKGNVRKMGQPYGTYLVVATLPSAVCSFVAPLFGTDSRDRALSVLECESGGLPPCLTRLTCLQGS